MKVELIKSIVFTCMHCGRWIGRAPAWADELGNAYQCECGCTSCRVRDGKPYGPRSRHWEELLKEFYYLDLPHLLPWWREHVVVSYSSGLFERFWGQVKEDPTTGCWVWGGRLWNGYGRFFFGGRGGKTQRAHRLSYRWFAGPIPSWLQLDHLCRNRACVNPAHLEAVTPGDNIRRGETGITAARRQRAKTHCPHGHPYTEENLYRYGNSRWCKTCCKGRARTSWLKQKAAV